MFGLVQDGVVVGVNSVGFKGQAGEVIEFAEIQPGQLWDGSELTHPLLSFEEFEQELTRAYAAAMAKACNGYSQEEANTWGEKREASKARMAGTDDALDRVTLAKIAGVINGEMFLTPERVTELDGGLTVDDLAAVDATAAKIYDARIRFNTWAGEIERLRDKHWLAGKENGAATYQAEVDGLAADYATLEATHG